MGQILKKRRIDAGLDIKDVAHRLRVSYQYVRQLEEGVNRPPTWGLLKKFADVYGCSVDSLFALEKEEENGNVNINGDLAELIKTIRSLPKYRQRDLLAMAKMFAERKEKDNTLALSAVLDMISESGNQDAENLLLDLFDRRDRDSGGHDLPLE